MRIDKVLNDFPIYKNILKYLSRSDCVFLSRTCKEIYKTMMNYGFLKIIDITKEIDKSIVEKHMRTLKYINFYKINDNIFKYLPKLNKNVEVRVRECRNILIQKYLECESIYNIIILGYKHGITDKQLQKLKNLYSLGIENLKQNNIICLNNLEILKIYGNININLIQCPKLNSLFYYITHDNTIDIINLNDFKCLEYVTIFLSIYTNLKNIKLNLNIQHITIIVNNIIYYNNFNNICDNKFKKFRKIQNISKKDNYYIINPVITEYNNLYYY